jgi:hypothetical protein
VINFRVALIMNLRVAVMRFISSSRGTTIRGPILSFAGMASNPFG